MVIRGQQFRELETYLNTHSTLPLSSATFSTADALDQYVIANEEPRAFDGLWHPSSISGCARKAVYEMRQTPPSDPPTSKQKRVFYIGHRIHETMQAAVAASPGVARVYTEVKVLIPELNTTGAGDQVTIFKDGSAALEEFKSIKEWAFKRLTGPKDDHLEQVKPYVYGLREFGGVTQDGERLEPLGDRLGYVRFTYIEKATFDTREFVVPWDGQWERDIRRTIAGLESYKDDPLSLPPRLPKDGKKLDYRCDWGWGRCPFFTRCYQEDPSEIPPSPDIY